MTTALNYIDGFGYTDGTNNGRWTISAGTFSNVAGRYEPGAMAPGTTGMYRTVTLRDTHIVGFAFFPSQFTLTNFDIVKMNEGATNHVSLDYNLTSKLLSVKRNGTTLATGTTVIPSSEWTYIEFACWIHDTTGAYEVRVNGETEIINSVPADTRNGGTGAADRIEFLWNTGFGQAYIDDVYIRIGNTGFLNSEFLGDSRVHLLLPDNDGSTSQWTPSPSTVLKHSMNVDEASPDSDTTYIQADTVGFIDLFGHEGLRQKPNTIHAVQLGMNAKFVTGASNLRSVYRFNDTNSEGSSHALTSSYVDYIRSINATNPLTANPWQFAHLNDTQIGVKYFS